MVRMMMVIKFPVVVIHSDDGNNCDDIDCDDDEWVNYEDRYHFFFVYFMLRDKN